MTEEKLSRQNIIEISKMIRRKSSLFSSDVAAETSSGCMATCTPTQGPEIFMPEIRNQALEVGINFQYLGPHSMD